MQAEMDMKRMTSPTLTEDQSKYATANEDDILTACKVADDDLTEGGQITLGKSELKARLHQEGQIDLPTVEPGCSTFTSVQEPIL